MPMATGIQRGVSLSNVYSVKDLGIDYLEHRSLRISPSGIGLIIFLIISSTVFLTFYHQSQYMIVPLLLCIDFYQFAPL